MKTAIAVLLCLTLSAACFAADNGFKVTYDGGSLANAKAGNGVKLYIEGDRIRLVKGKEDIAVIPASAVTEISYGEDVHRRVGAAIGLAFVSLGVGALMALSKSKKHFIGLTWNDAGKGLMAEEIAKGGFAMQCDKADYRGILAGIEGVTGRKSVDSAALSVKN
jgi:hypothetical protein